MRRVLLRRPPPPALPPNYYFFKYISAPRSALNTEGEKSNRSNGTAIAGDANCNVSAFFLVVAIVPESPRAPVEPLPPFKDPFSSPLPVEHPKLNTAPPHTKVEYTPSRKHPRSYPPFTLFLIHWCHSYRHNDNQSTQNLYTSSIHTNPPPHTHKPCALS